MKKLAIILIAAFAFSFSTENAEDIIKKVDDNMSAKNRVVESTMIIHGKRKSRTMTSKSYSVGTEKSFTEYLSPSREKGTKMLKLEDKLWIYSPSTDRTIQISGHMLRQSVMGSDFSYEDMMDDRKLLDVYKAKIERIERSDSLNVAILTLTAKVDDIAYHSRKIWVDIDHYVPLKEELYGKSGKLLKKTILSDIKEIDGRWFPTKMVYKDMLKSGKGTEMHFNSIKFNQDIPEYIFTKAALKQ